MKKYPELGFKKTVAYLGEVPLDNYAVLILQHYRLEKEETLGLFIADGTAGQNDADYPLGYYGYLDNSPEKLRKIYIQKEKN